MQQLIRWKKSIMMAMDYLLYLKENLIKVHKKFYKVYDHYKSKSSEEKTCPVPDLKAIVPSIRRSTLAGVNVVFSGVFPTDIPPEKSRAWRVAKEFGANVSSVDDWPF